MFIDLCITTDQFIDCWYTAEWMKSKLLFYINQLLRHIIKEVNELVCVTAVINNLFSIITNTNREKAILYALISWFETLLLFYLLAWEWGGAVFLRNAHSQITIVIKIVAIYSYLSNSIFIENNSIWFSHKMFIADFL